MAADLLEGFLSMTVRTPGEGGTLSQRPPSPLLPSGAVTSPATDRLDFMPAVSASTEEEGSLRTGAVEVGAPPLPTPPD